MKKFVVVSIAAIAFALLASCGTAPKPQAAASDSAAKDSGQTAAKGTSKEDKAFDKVYTQAKEKIDTGDTETYVVQSGDTLTAITKQYYGDDKGYYFPMIMAASSDVVTNPDLIVPGMELSIPDYDANMNNPKIRAALKGVFKKVANIYAKQDKTDMENHLLEVADSL